MAVVAVVGVVVEVVASAAAMTAVEIVAVAAEVSGAIATVVVDTSSASVVDAPAESHGPVRARGTAEFTRTPPEDVTPAAATAPARPVVELPAEWIELANEIGAAWAQTYVRTLQAQDRDIVGAWPGTIREARRQVLARLKAKPEAEQMDQLARLTNLAARRGWETVSEPDLES